MAIPNVNVTPLSTGVGIILPGTNELPCNIMGWTSQGTAAQPTSFIAGSLSNLTAEFGVGPAVELAASVLTQGASEVILTRILGATIAATFAKSGSGPNITASGNPLQLYGNPTATGSTGILIDIDLGGTIGTATFSYSLDGGVTFVGPIVTQSGAYLIPGTGVSVTFAAGTWVADDTYTGAITTAVGSSSAVQQLPVPGQSVQGAGAVSMDATNNPQDAYNAIVLITSSGVLGAGEYSYSLDGGLNFSSDTLIPSSGPSILGSSGIVIDWANSGGSGMTSGFVEGESYIFTTLAPSISSTEIIQTCDAIAGNALQWDWAHVVGRPSSNSAAASLFAALSTQAGTWWSAGRYSWFVMETPTVTQTNNGAASLVTAFASSASDYVSVGAGDFNCQSPISGQAIQRNAAWAATIWGSGKKVGIDLAAPVLGTLPFVVAELWNSQQDGSLDNSRFTTLRTFHNIVGNFICNAWIKSSSLSDILYWQHRRILNAAARIAYQVLLQYLSTPLLVNKSDGTVATSAAIAIQNATMRAINQGLAGQITGSSAVVDTSNDILETEQLNESIGVIPFGYPKQINVDIGFVDPAISTQ